MSSRVTRNRENKCPTCNKYIENVDYTRHVRTCRIPDDDQENVSEMKKCQVCKKSVKDLARHMNTCNNDDSSTRNETRILRNSAMSSSKSFGTNSRRRNFKECPLCGDMIDEDDYKDHVDDCGLESHSTKSNQRYDDDDINLNSRESMRDPRMNEYSNSSNKTNYSDRIVNQSNTKSSRASISAKVKKQCTSCWESIDERYFANHIVECDVRSQHSRTSVQKNKRCQTCDQMIPQNEYADHTEECENRRQSFTPQKVKQCQHEVRSKSSKTKHCQNCNQNILEREYFDHMEQCQDNPRSRSSRTKQCQTCDQKIPEVDYVDHMDRCVGRKSSKRSIVTVRQSSTGECPFCFEEYSVDELEEHVRRCENSSSKANSKSSATRIPPKTCFTCSASINLPRDGNLIIPCQFKHAYCAECLQQSMNKHLESNTPPVCNSDACNYELSRYNVYCLPLDVQVIQRLLPLVKSTQRPQCPTCSFYVEMDTMDDYEKHIIKCTGDGIPCQYCNCLITANEFTDHEGQCRRIEPSTRQQTYLNFILSRTKYPMTIHELRVFLNERKKDHLSTDVHDIVNTLAELDGIFPYDIPTRDCDICAESFVYDDIFVFGCDENHKLCYDCFADSTANKMKNNEILTCAMCNYQLQDGEIKQLRIPAEQKRQYIEYQTNKTFSNFAGGQGILKCPNKGCKWVAQLTDPNERFKVTCRACNHEFCSLCSQQYHYRTRCQQLPELTQRWFFWCNTERGNYWQARAQQDATYQTQLQDYERQRAANEQRNTELRQRYDELVADEQYKAQNCRLCPHCQRVVQHLSGCDLMTCGQNYHGGDKQSGCGQGFRWSQALPYQAVNTGPQQVENNIAAPEAQRTVVHEGVQCDACHNEIQGIRFDCIHCASLIFCEKCEQRATLEHSNQLRDQNRTQHVFKLITTPQNQTTN